MTFTDSEIQEIARNHYNLDCEIKSLNGYDEEALAKKDEYEAELKTLSKQELKDLCAVKQAAMTAEDMRLIFKGKILKDDLTLDEYKITDGLTVHLVKGKSSTATTAETGSTLA